MRRQVAGGPEPMDLCSAESETSRSQAKKRPQLCYRCGKAGHYFYECSVTPSTHARQCVEAVRTLRKVRDEDQPLLRRRNSGVDRQKTVGISRGGAPY